MSQYLPILVMIVLAALFGGISLVMAKLLNPSRPTAAQTAPYECGIVEQTESPERFPVRFYLVAMIFIVFDIEIIFLYPFTTVYGRLGTFGLLAVIEFAVAVFASFLYLIANGALDWGPAKQSRKGDLGIDSARTSTSTIRRVGLEGREAA
ncbi:MAG TPA: NADH-quinone oxidoreductase subunit A [Microthrixaceae bacterium]|nr:NADH-quinone oxidoreductase subunit A [Microthrixaceae bacterium]HNI35393.1 NADH-quinone oxidoreductase subunit A [Microthrixaceae bacterium]